MADVSSAEVPLPLDQFFAIAFHDLTDGASPAIRAAEGSPGSLSWRGGNPLTDKINRVKDNTNYYVSCSSYELNEQGRVRDEAKAVDACHFLMLNVGPDQSLDRVRALKPTWIIETSPGRHQCGFVFDKAVTEIDDIFELERRAVAAGVTESHRHGISLRARLPIGVNGKFDRRTKSGAPKCGLVEWHPENIHSYESLLRDVKSAQAIEVVAEQIVQCPMEPPLTPAKTLQTQSIVPVVDIAEPATEPSGLVEARSVLAKFSLKGKSAMLEKTAVEQVPVMGSLALRGQATVIYAQPNLGKTLISLHLLMKAIDEVEINPKHIFYVNMDDGQMGLLEKTWMADEYDFEILSGGYENFSTLRFFESMKSMIENRQVNGAIVVLDTLKKFVDTMDKKRTREFGKMIRLFVSLGGTVIALSHTNKKPGSDGSSIHSGTNDILEDFDSAWIADVVPESIGKPDKVVMFQNKKRRGNQPDKVVFTYANAPEITYQERLASVRELDAEAFEGFEASPSDEPEAPIVEAIEGCIKEGIHVKKIRLRNEAAKRARISRQRAQQVLEKFQGVDPQKHRWTFEVGAHNTHTYVLLKSAEVIPTA